MSIVGLTCVLLALVAALLAVMYLLQRRELAAIDHVSQQVQRIAIGGSMHGRVEVANEGHEVSLLATAVNHLLTRVTSAGVVERVAPPLFAELADRIHEAVLVHGDTILHVNRQFAALMGVERAQLMGRRLGDMLPEEYAELVNGNIASRLAGEPAAERYEIEVSGHSGEITRLEITSTVIEYEGAQALLMTGVEIMPSATAGRPAGADGPRSGGAGSVALDALSEAVLTTDGRGLIDYMNPAAMQLTGLERAQFLGRSLGEVMRLVDEADGRPLRDPIQHALSQAPGMAAKAVLLPLTSGAESAVELSAAPLPGAHAGVVLMLRDVTVQRGLTRQISYQATHDALTGLVNRREFERRVSEAIDSAHRGEGRHVLCFLDFDRFKAVNDTSGHLAGDNMPRELARLLRECVRDSDIVGRLGGDEFGMLLVGCPLDKARQIAADVCRKVAEYRLVWKDRLFDVGASIGLVEIWRESGSAEDMLAAADAACYVAKKEGTGRVSVYSARDEALARHSGEIHWLQRLQLALKENRFHLYYQTIVPAKAGDAAEPGPRLEVLVRLSDESGRAVAPGEFMRAAERHKLMRLVDRWVVQTTLAALSRGDLNMQPQQSVSINLSAQTVADEQFLEFVVECLDRSGVPPRQLCFEVSEAAVSGNIEAARRFIGVLHGMGCEFALDDFGSDVGSFSRLRNLPLDYLKIDGTLVRNLARDSVNQAMVTAMIKLARSMRFKVIAEQVEDAAAADFVRQLGVDYLQGYAIGVPRPFPVAA